MDGRRLRDDLGLFRRLAAPKDRGESQRYRDNVGAVRQRSTHAHIPPFENSRAVLSILHGSAPPVDPQCSDGQLEKKGSSPIVGGSTSIQCAARDRGGALEGRARRRVDDADGRSLDLFGDSEESALRVGKRRNRRLAQLSWTGGARGRRSRGGRELGRSARPVERPLDGGSPIELQ